ncbi:Protein PNS1 [Seminavis robusta]|uniref:Choline transporter-like protein n=1 Tax=Seminavis robusta TaxID=568900 RepID=A0A9N8HFP0_9STRA|nr:Protein PNS1 [Seminavis robusta]|eukprot:Sro358_g125750.1 Protein PNS1 (540) ;mRNA; f:1614-3550
MTTISGLTANSTTPYLNANNPQNAPVIVQGKVVSTPNKGFVVPSTAYHPRDSIVEPIHNPQDFKRDPSPRRCNDLIWAILFLIHLGAMVWVAIYYIPQMTNRLGADYAADANNDDHRRFLEEDQDWSYQNIDNGYLYDNNAITLNLPSTIAVVAVTCVSGIFLATTALGFMVLFAETLIRVGFIATALLSLVMGMASVATGQIAAAIASFVMFVLVTWYACNAWARIPFAATNLVTATTIVRDNLGVAVYAYLSLALAFGWAVWWTSATIAALFVLGDCEGDGTCNNDLDPFLIFLFLASYHWTFHVIANVVTVTVAGVSGTWWMVPSEGNQFCSKAVTDSYYRANTLAFGSICLGSLVVAIVSAAKEIIRQMRDGRDSVLVCIAEFLLGCIKNILEYFNEWAFCFVGIYGYSFVESGMQVMDLLRSRGWTSIITDDLSGRALFIVSFFVALLNGLIGWAFGSVIPLGEGVPEIVPFLIAMVTGFTLCSTLFSVVGSACKSVIVLYAEAPNEFQANHPELSNRMRISWQQAWPVDFKYG